MPSKVRILLFASAREAVGRPRLDRPLPEGGTTAQRLLDDLVEEFPRLARVLSASRIVVNGEPVRAPSTALGDGDELAIHPPYSGG